MNNIKSWYKKIIILSVSQQIIRYMQRFVIIYIIIIFGAVSAQAQQSRPPSYPATLWEGAYAGIHAGIGTADFDGVFDSSSIDRPRDNEDAVLGQFFDLNGGFSGVQIGYNFSIGRFVYGLEADWSSLSQSDRLFDPEDEGPNGATTDNAIVDLNWVASLRGRLGIMSGRSLLFATAGIAWIDGHYTARDDDEALPGQVIAGTTDISTVGIVVGGGIEHALTQRFLIRLEGLYHNFNDRVDTSNLNNDSSVDDFAKIEDILIARFAASYRFGEAATVEQISFEKSVWSGLYAGGHVGYAHVSFDSLFDGSEISNPFDNEDSVLGQYFDLNGTIAGVQLGYNQAYGPVVYGVEVDWTNLRKSDRLFDPDGGDPDDDSASVDLHWMATLRGRVGVTLANTLFFATAGAAWIKGDYAALDDMVTEGKISINDIGLVLGGGLEHALNNNWRIRLEGLHYSFGNKNDTSSLTPESDIGDYAELEDITIFRLGANYKLNFGN